MAVRNKTLDFAIIGVGKSGTTSLAGLLAQHPDIALTDPKEPWFFDSENYHRGMAWYWQHYLGHYRGESRVGEATSHTLYVPYAAQRLHRVTPDARLIALLRHPVERAHSDWWMKHCQGTEPDDFDTAVARNLEKLQGSPRFSEPADWQRHLESVDRRLHNQTYVDFGCYATQLERLYSVYPREQVAVLLTEDLQDATLETLRQLCRFLGVSDDLAGLELDLTPRNPAGNFGTSRLRRAFYRVPGGRPLAGLSARLLPDPLRNALTRPVKNVLGGARPPVSAATRALLDEFYSGEILRLETLTGRDLSAWKANGAATGRVDAQL
jgi:hypothetical protein